MIHTEAHFEDFDGGKVEGVAVMEIRAETKTDKILLARFYRLFKRDTKFMRWLLRVLSAYED